MQHIDKETLSAFLDNKLLGKAKTDVINHLRVCDECRLLMAETSTFLQECKTEEEPKKPIKKSLLKKLQPYSIAMAVAASIVLVLIPITQMQEDGFLTPSQTQMPSATIQEMVEEKKVDIAKNIPMPKKEYKSTKKMKAKAEVSRTYVAKEKSSVSSMADLGMNKPSSVQKDCQKVQKVSLDKEFFSIELPKLAGQVLILQLKNGKGTIILTQKKENTSSFNIKTSKLEDGYTVEVIDVTNKVVYCRQIEL